jgi:hypothetical protein
MTSHFAEQKSKCPDEKTRPSCMCTAEGRILYTSYKPAGDNAWTWNHLTIFWDITPCSPLKVNRRFGVAYRLHLQGRRINRAKTSVKEGGKWTSCSTYEDEGDMFLRNVGWLLRDYTALYPRRQYSSKPPLWELQTLHIHSYRTLSRVCMVLNNELERIWKEAVVVTVPVFVWRIEKVHEKRKSL